MCSVEQTPDAGKTLEWEDAVAIVEGIIGEDWPEWYAAAWRAAITAGIDVWTGAGLSGTTHGRQERAWVDGRQEPVRQAAELVILLSLEFGIEPHDYPVLCCAPGMLQAIGEAILTDVPPDGTSAAEARAHCAGVAREAMARATEPTREAPQ